MGIETSATGRNANTGVDRRQTSCSVCGCGIFAGQERVWSRNPLGLVHAWCATSTATTGGTPS